MRDVSEHKLSNLRTEVPKLCSPDSKGSVTISHGIRGNIPVMAPLNMRREKKPTRCHWMVYCTYSMLKMFRALLCPSSGARDYTCMCVITAECGHICGHTTKICTSMYFSWLFQQMQLWQDHDDGDYTEICWSFFNVNFNVNFKIVFKTI